MASGNFKLSVVLEAITSAFNSSVKDAATTFSKAESDMAAAASSAATATKSAEANKLTSFGDAAKAATAAGAAEVKASQTAAAAATSGAATASAAARSTAAANAAVKPPASFASFFTAIKEGWQQGAAEARAATAATSAAADGAGAHVKALKNEVDGIGPAARKSGTEANQGLTLTGLVKQVAGLVAFKEAIQAIGTNAIQVQQITNQLNFATGGAAQGAAAFAFLRDTANSLGLSLEASAKGFAQLATSTKGTQLEGQATRDLFLGVSQAAATMGLSVEDTNGVFNALSQIASKGTVQMEELRGQLGDRLPGVLKVAADAMHVTVEQLNTMVGSGLDATVFLKAFGPALQSAFSESAGKNLATLGGQVTLLKNQFFDLLDTINKAGAANAFTALVREAVAALETIKQAFKEAGNSPEMVAIQAAFERGFADIKTVVGQLVETFGTIYQALNESVVEIQNLTAEFTTAGTDGSQSLSLLQVALLGINLTIAGISDGIKTLQIGFELLKGFSQGFYAAAISDAAVLVGVFNKDLAQSLTDYAAKLKAASDASYASADAKAQAFKSSVTAVLDGVAETAAKVAAQATTAASQTLASADAALAKLIASTKPALTASQQLQAAADEVSKSYVKLGETGVLSQEQVGAKLKEVAALLPTVAAPAQNLLTYFKAIGAAGIQNLGGDITAGTAKGIEALSKLADNAVITKAVFKQELTQLVDGAKTADDIKLVEGAIATLASSGKLTQAAITELFNQVRDKAIAIGPEIEKSLSEAFTRVGVVSKATLGGAVTQAQNDLLAVQKAAGEGLVSYDAVTKAQEKLSAAQAAATPGAVTLADVTKRLADINRDCADAVITNAKHIDTFAESVAKSKAASQTLTTASGGLATAFNDQKSALLALSAAAANDFGRRLGVQFGYVEAGAASSQSSIEGLTQELGRLSQFSASPDFTGIGNKFREIAAAGVATQLAFAQEKQATDAWADSIQSLASSGTASLKDLERAANMGVSATTLLGDSDLSKFRSALDSAKNRIDAIKNASLSATDALKSMGDSLQIELLRAKGDNVAVIQAEAAAQQATIDAQIKALGANASAAAIAEANRASALLAQVTANKIAEQKASDLAAATQASADKAAELKAAQAAAAVPPVATPTTTAANDPTIAPGKQITLRFEDASGNASTATVASTQAADDLLAILTRAGATNITKQGAA